MSIRCTPPRSERGETLIELVVAVAILGMAAVAILGGLMVSIQSSVMHRNDASGGAYVRSFAEAIQTDVDSSGYKSCANALNPSAGYADVAVPRPAPGLYQVRGSRAVLERVCLGRLHGRRHPAPRPQGHHYRGLRAQGRRDLDRNPAPALQRRRSECGGRPVQLIRERLRRLRGDDGFTLIEMVMSVAILGIISAALLGVMLQYLKTASDTSARLNESTDQQFISTYWQDDVSSLGRQSLAPPASFTPSQSVFVGSAGPGGCGSSVGSVVVAFAWNEFEVNATNPDHAWDTTPQEVAYVIVPSGRPHVLQRVRCENGVARAPQTVAHSLVTPPTISCNTSCGADPAAEPGVDDVQRQGCGQPEQPGLHDHRLGRPEAGMTKRLRALRDHDSGAMLIVALIIITSVAVVTGALLTHGGTNFRATTALEGVAGTSYTADSAAKVAINNLRLGAGAPGWDMPSFPGLWDDWVYTNGADGAGCFGVDEVTSTPENILELNNVYPKAGDQAG